MRLARAISDHLPSQRLDLAQQSTKPLQPQTATVQIPQCTPTRTFSNTLQLNSPNPPPNELPNQSLTHIPSPLPSPITDQVISQDLSGPTLTVTITHPLRTAHAAALWAREGERAHDILNDLWRALFTVYLERRETEGHGSVSMQARAKSVLAMLEEVLSKGVDIAWGGKVYATSIPTHSVEGAD